MTPNFLADPDSLRCFEAAARHLSFRAAAREVALSPPAVSDRIRKLEDDLGTELFVRTTRRVSLTEAGARLLPRAREALAAIGACTQAVHEDVPVPYELMVGTRFELGLSWLTPALDQLAAWEPGRRVHLAFGDSPDLLARTLKGDLDATITSARLAWERYAYSLLHEEDYAFVVSPQSLEKNSLEGTQDAAHWTLVDASSDLPLFRYFRDARPSQETWRFAAVERLGAIGAIRLRVLAGAGCAVLPRYLVRPDLERGDLVEVFARTRLLSDHFRLVWRAGHPRAPDLERLGQHLRELPLQ